MPMLSHLIELKIVQSASASSWRLTRQTQDYWTFKSRVPGILGQCPRRRAYDKRFIRDKVGRFQHVVGDLELGPASVGRYEGNSRSNWAFVVRVGVAPGVVFDRRYIGSECADLDLMFVADEKEGNVRAANGGLAVEFRGDNRMFAATATSPPPTIE